MGTEKRVEQKRRLTPVDSELPGPAPTRVESVNGRPPAWGVLIYLAGDVDDDRETVHADLLEILTAGGSPDVQIAVQYDGPDGATRHIVSASSRPDQPPVQRFKKIDSGSSAAMLDFLRWGMSSLRTERLALVIRSPFVVSPGESDPDTDRGTLFSLTYDATSGTFLDVCDMADVLRQALRDAARPQVDLLVIDSCQVQFLELAYELEDIVRILIAPQTRIPKGGWDYGRVLTEWKRLAAERPPVGTPRLAEALLGFISACYTDRQQSHAVSALDLQRLDEVARTFDTMCISTLQVLGEGLVWQTRALLLKKLQQNSDPVYDCGSFFRLWEVALRAMVAEAHQRWLGTTLQRVSGRKLDRFFEAVARQIEATAVDTTRDSTPTIQAAVRERCARFLTALQPNPRSGPSPHKDVGQAVLDDIDAGFMRRLDSLDRDVANEVLEIVAARESEALIRSAIDQAHYLLPRERQIDLRRMRDSVVSASRLAHLSKQAAQAVVGDSPSGIAGMVIAVRTEPPAAAGWPRWSGVSMYRPKELNDLMNAAYTRFALHRRVHWAALLGAANLIEGHPRALWRLVSSLLATGGAGTRRDVLRRLTGSDSVIWGLRDQFQVMAPAPTLTLSLEQRKTETRDAANGRDTTHENYLLRLESITRGAVVTEQESRVQPAALERALSELNALLKKDVMTAQSLAELRSIGGLLGEDIFQALGRTLEEERRAVQDESPELTPHLQLQIPRDLMKYPWELLHHHGEWLGERYAMGRQVFMETGLARRVPGRRQGRVKPLIVGDPLFDDTVPYRQLPGARDEAEQVAGWFERAAQQVGSIIDFDRSRDTYIHKRVTGAKMRALLREGEYDIVHFAGHGVFNADDPETSAWLMSDGRLWSLEIRNTLAELPGPPWLVYANACEAGMDGARPPLPSYQGNVFGLATAFINQGVAAYIAPLWPIDDLLAQHIAIAFYRELLCERATLGESLRRAKASARRLAYPDARDNPDDESVWSGLGWASLVLYGDPTEELFQALAGGPTDERKRETATRQQDVVETARAGRPTVPARPAKGVGPAANVLHAPDHVVAEWVRGPNWIPQRDQRSMLDAPNDDRTYLELIEDAGLRRWRVRQRNGASTRGASSANDGLPGSQVAALMLDDRVRGALPATRGAMRVVGRWLIGGFKDGTRGLVAAYDREQVSEEQLLILNGTTSQHLVSARRERGAVSTIHGQEARALVLIHGTFSKTASPVDGFGPEFMAWARQRYRVVLGLDHWTLSKTPEENARLLINELRVLNSDYLKPESLDVITHSRGGLVARSFCELLNQMAAVRHLVFVGTPNCGTDLANPKNWGTLADLLVNMTGVDGAELFGRLAGLLAQLAVTHVVNDVPGLLAQSPDAAAKRGTFLHRLQTKKINRSTLRYGVVCSEFEPSTLVPNLKKIVEAAKAASVDVTMDALFASANDLVVNTAHAWGIGVSPEETLKGLPRFLAPERVLVYQPPRTEFKPAFLPKEQIVEALGVHHCNLFSQARVRETIKSWLAES